MNQSKVVLYIAMSLDGYIARKDGSVDWLFDVEGDGGDNGYSLFYQTIDAVVMGRATYEEVLTLADPFPYADRECYVMSRSSQASAPYVTFTNEPVKSLVSSLKERVSRDIWLVGGGQLVQAFLEENLVDEMQIAVIPKILGEGIPLFPVGTVPSVFRLTDITRMGQIAMLQYRKA